MAVTKKFNKQYGYASTDKMVPEVSEAQLEQVEVFSGASEEKKHHYIICRHIVQVENGITMYVGK